MEGLDDEIFDLFWFRTDFVRVEADFLLFFRFWKDFGRLGAVRSHFGSRSLPRLGGP